MSIGVHGISIAISSSSSNYLDWWTKWQIGISAEQDLCYVSCSPYMLTIFVFFVLCLVHESKYLVWGYAKTNKMDGAIPLLDIIQDEGNDLTKFAIIIFRFPSFLLVYIVKFMLMRTQNVFGCNICCVPFEKVGLHRDVTIWTH